VLGEKLIAIVGVTAVFALFFSVLIYSEVVTDEKRILVTELGILNQTIAGQSIEFPSGSLDADIHFVELLPKAESGWHTHSVPVIATVIHGEITVYYCFEDLENPIKIEQCPEGGTVRHYSTGDTFVEAINIEHNGVNDSIYPVKMHIVTLSPDEDWTDIYSD
jgi:quercetin dioxygenase-like cupin family protein